jgi:hypothetical protein
LLRRKSTAFFSKRNLGGHDRANDPMQQVRSQS